MERKSDWRNDDVIRLVDMYVEGHPDGRWGGGRHPQRRTEKSYSHPLVEFRRDTMQSASRLPTGVKVTA